MRRVYTAIDKVGTLLCIVYIRHKDFNFHYTQNLNCFVEIMFVLG